MGIRMISGPRANTNEAGGPLPLPSTFDRKKFAAKWVKEGSAVEAAGNREQIPGTILTADGWTVWRDEEGKPVVVPLQSGKHILLHRPRAVQDAVNAISGNVGKERLKQEKNGETTGGVPVNDPGLLSDERITKVTGVQEELGEGDVKMNPVPDVERDHIEPPVIRTALARRGSPVRRVAKTQ